MRFKLAVPSEVSVGDAEHGGEIGQKKKKPS